MQDTARESMAIRFRSSDLMALGRIPFGDLPASLRVTIFGVDYVWFDIPGHGQLFVTRHGWPRLGQLLPEEWFCNEQYVKRGWRLPGSTGHVYRVPASDPRFRRDLVVKFCRFAQDVPVHVSSEFLPGVAREIMERAKFNSPFEEFGLLMDLRRGRFGPAGLRIRTKQPLAIFCPYEHFELWEMGRNRSQFFMHQLALRRDQEGVGDPVELDIHRLYILVFGWVEGQNAEDMHARGLISEDEMTALTRRVADELARKGYQVLDHKPRHVILRERPAGQILRRGKQVDYALIDFELLCRTTHYQDWLRARRSISRIA